MESDPTLLRRFADSRCQQAFAHLVDRYAGMVFAVALQRTGDRELAQEISQNVFLALSRKASQLNRDASLASWLHRVTMLESAALLRAEARRRRRHEKLAAMNTIDHESAAESEAIPLLDEAVQKLKETDRELLFRRFLEGMSFAEISQHYGINEAAGRKRVSRILKKLSHIMSKQGVTVSTVALGTAMTAHWSKAAPAGLTHTISQTAFAGSVAGTSQVTLFTAMITSKLSAVTVAALGAAIPFSMQWAHSKREEPDINMIGLEESHPSLEPPVSPILRVEEEAKVAAGFSIAALARELRKLPLPNGSLKRELELELLMHSLSEGQVRQVVPLLKDAPNAKALHRIVSAVFGRWATFNPAEAAEAALDFGELRAVAQRGVLLSWVETDAEAAFRYMETSVLSNSTRGDLRVSHDLLSKILRVTENPSRALERMEALTNTDLGKSMAEGILKAWAKESPDDAFQWIQAKEDYGLRNTYTQTFIHDLAPSNPSKSFELAMSLEQPKLREESVRWTLMQWRDRAKAREAYLTLPDAVRTEHLTMNVAPFLGKDAAAAFEVARQLPEGFHRDQFQYAGIRGSAKASPEAAAEAAGQITHQRTRKQALEFVARQWLQQDANQARSWIETESGLPNESVEKLLENVKQ